MLLKLRNNPFLRPPVLAAKQLQPTSCVIHHTLYKTSTYHTWPPNWKWNPIPWPGGLTVSCFTGHHGDDWWDCAGGRKWKRKEKERKENEKEKDNGKVVLSWNILASDYFSLSLVVKKKLPSWWEKRWDEGEWRVRGGGGGVEMRSQADKRRKVTSFTFSFRKEKKIPADAWGDVEPTLESLGANATSCQCSTLS